MKYAMLSALIPKELEVSYRNNIKDTMQDAANALQWNIYEGLQNNLEEDIELFNILPVDSFPQYYKRPFVKGQYFGEYGYNIGFCNIKLLRIYAKKVSIYRVLKEWILKDSERKTLFVYTLSHSFISAIAQIKQEFLDLKVCVIVADLPHMSSLSRQHRFLRKLFVNRQSEDTYKNLNVIDGFVLLTEQMADYLKIHQPYCVVEGIAEERSYIKYTNLFKLKTVVYTGTLHEKFGVIHLVKAFEEIKSNDYQLILCGIGDGEEKIKRAQMKDSRIKYMGQVTREEALDIQGKATVLVNPRLNNEEFTKYSFPSKTMEYLSSGIPVIAYKLDGIPKEYDDYIQYPDDQSVKSLAKKIIEICEWNDGKRRSVGEMSREFVLTNKNRDTQARKIIELVEELS